MVTRFKRTALSFVAVLAAFIVYRLIAVPLIEPRIDTSKRVAQVSQSRLEAARKQQGQSRLGGYSRFFQQGSWELENPIILESDTSKVLLKEYTTLPDGRVQVTPCTVIYLPDGDAEAANSTHRVIILQNPHGALLQFDGEVDLSRGKLGKLLGGRLDGPITIRSAATKPDGSDDLLVTTHDVQMKDTTIFTPNEVDFRFGPSYGHGRNMKIEMLPGPDNGAKTRGPSIGGLQSFELATEVEMHLQPGSSGFMPGDRSRAVTADATTAQPQPNSLKTRQLPVEVRCQGPFQFDLIAYIATFHDAVDVRRPNPLGGQGDQMNCELLSIFFAPKESAGAPNGKPDQTKKSAAKPQAMPQLEPRRFEAKGIPVVVHAPSRNVDARAQTLQYDIVTGRMGMQSSDEVELHQESNEAHAKSFVYEPGPDGAWLGYLDSDGPGWLTAASRDNPEQRFQARWAKKLTMLPQDQNHVISLTGSAWASYADRGSLSADEIHVWLYEVPVAQRTAQPQRRRTGNSSGGTGDALTWIRPVKMFADGGVNIDSPQLSGHVKRMNAWFREPALGSQVNQIAADNGPAPPSSSRPSTPQRSPLAPRNSGAPQAHYEIKRGGLLEAWLTSGRQAQVEDVVLKDDVEFIQTPGPDDTQPPLQLVGDQITVLHAPDAEIAVQGHPGQIGAQGLMMFGSAIQLNRPESRLWINGAGRMTWTGARASAKPAAQPDANAAAPSDAFSVDGPMDIDWRDKMTFDGRTALYEGDVVSHRVGNRIEDDGRRSQLTQTVRTPSLEVTLHEPVNFADLRPGPQTAERRQMEQMKCHGDVQLENRELIDGHPAALEQMQLRDLVVSGITGAMSSQGPGRLYSWRLGSPSALLTPQATLANRTTGRAGNPITALPVATGAAAASKPVTPQIYYLDVQFQNGITGNVLGRRQLTFNDQVRSLYGPVGAWDARLDPDDPHGIAPQCMLLSCDQMTVSEAGPRVNGGRSPMEMDARGNTRTEGQGETGEMFTAEAAGLSYSEAKGMLILRGDGRSDAQLFRQERPGAKPEQLRAGEIQYWPLTRRTYIPSAHSFNASQIGTTNSTRPATQPAAGTGIAR